MVTKRVLKHLGLFSLEIFVYFGNGGVGEHSTQFVVIFSLASLEVIF
jgi:hypothetical protein